MGGFCFLKRSYTGSSIREPSSVVVCSVVALVAPAHLLQLVLLPQLVVAVVEAVVAVVVDYRGELGVA